MNRPSDWEPLHHTDPVPGDVEGVRKLSQHLRDVATAIQEQSEKLRQLCTDDYWKGDAADTFRQTAETTSTKLQQVKSRYSAAATAIASYQATLDREQHETDTLRKQAQALEDDRRAAQQRLDADPEPTEDGPPPRAGKALDESTVSNYAGQLQQLRSRMYDSQGYVAEAARKAISDIDTAISDDGLKDGRFDGVKKWAADKWDATKQWIRDHADILKMIANVAGWIATICGTLALLVSWIPVIGQALAAVLGAIALVATLVSLVCNLALWLAGVQGLTAALIDVVGLLTFGVGRAAIGGVKGAMAAVNASGKLSKAASTMGPAILTKGGKVGEAAAEALARGNFSKAASLSGIKASTLKGMMGSRLGGLTDDFGRGGFKYLQTVMNSAPGKFLPRGGDLLDAFNPKSILREFTDVGALGSKSNWSAAWQQTSSHLRGVTGQSWDVAKGLPGVRSLDDLGNSIRSFKDIDFNISAFDLDTMKQFDKLDDITKGISSSSFKDFQSTLASHKFTFTTNFATGVTVDVLDKLGKFSSAENWQKRAPL